MDNSEQITYFAETDARNRRVTFGIKAKDRTRHVYVIGKTGMGKSTLLENMAAQDVRNGNGFAFLDPHGTAIDTILKYIPKERIDDVVYFAPFDIEYPISFNVMEDVGYDKRHLVVSGLMSTFKKIWQDAWSARMEYILGNTLLALLEYPDATLLSVNKMLSDKNFRQKVVDNLTDTSVKSFWVDEFAKYTDRFAAEATPAIQNKIGQFTSNPLIRNIIGQPKSSFDLRKIMDEKKILIVNLSKGRIGESNANLLGSMIITKLYLAALSRADNDKDSLEHLPNFYLYVDEFQSFANDTFADILSEARKYKLNLTIAHQYIEQMTDEVRAAVFGNVGTMVSFRVGSYDADVLEKEFAPTFEAQDIVNLGFAQVYLRLMIDGIGSKPFSARTLPPLERPEKDFVEEIVGSSRRMYSKPRPEVESLINKLHNSNPESGSDPGSENKKDQHNREDHKKQKKALKKEQADSLKEALIEKVADENPDDDLEEISLSDLSLNVKRPEKKSQKDLQNNGGLKSALADILQNFEKNNSLDENDVPSHDSKKSIPDNEPKSPDLKSAPDKESKSFDKKPEKVLEKRDSKNSGLSEEDLRRLLKVD